MVVLRQHPLEQSGPSHPIEQSYLDEIATLAQYVETWFEQYKEIDNPDPSDPPRIGPEGMEKLCKDLDISIDGHDILIIAWLLMAERMGYFTLTEWTLGMKKIGAHSPETLKLALNPYRSILKDISQPQFRDLYRFSYEFARSSLQKSIPVEMAIGLWNILLPAATFTIMKSLEEYLCDVGPVKVITRDQWMSLLEFAQTVDPDLAGYDLESAWPVLLDDFVTWSKTRRETDVAVDKAD
ncbi:hypothetical protein BSLG_003968 [Batrachochytrium salamandrivorans]|nr:hypothetical protein BSLG_003968 [Batrachochytrium salamandrivorans]